MASADPLSLDQQAALLVAERLAIDPELTGDAATLLREVERADPDAVDNTEATGAWLERALARAGVKFTVAEVRAERDRTLHRDGRRIRLPARPCPHALRKMDNTEDPLRERPCVHRGGAGHHGHCEFADVPAPVQRATMAQFRLEVAEAARAFGVEPGDIVPGL